MNPSRSNRARTIPLLLTASAVAVAGVVGITAGQGAAAPSADKPSYPGRSAKFKRPKLQHGVLAIRGTDSTEKIALRLRAGEPNVLQVDVGDDGSADFEVERTAVAKIVVRARSGADVVRVDETNGAFTDQIPTTISGDGGNDTISGGRGVETLLGGAGDDSIDGNGGNDVSELGPGDDAFVWDPGDGSDQVEGQSGLDTMLFNGAAAGEQVDVSANGTRLRFFRQPGNITMDTEGVERVAFEALGGADVVTVGNLTGTGVGTLEVDLAGALGGATGDGQADRIVVNATDGDDIINVNGDPGGVKASGLAATVVILHSEASDRLEVNTLAGTDTVDSGGLAAGAIALLVDGVLVP